MSSIRGSVLGTAALLLGGAFMNALIVATADNPPPWGWVRLLVALCLAVTAIQLVVSELRAADVDGGESVPTLER